MLNLIIAIDGYSSTGKGVFAKLISKELGLPYIDSGAIYRAITLYALNNGLVNSDGDILENQLKREIDRGNIQISIEMNNSASDSILLAGEDVSDRIRKMDVAKNVSAVSAIPFVRDFVDNVLHNVGKNGCVMDGRDIGTAVFPDADLKIFMTADPEIRAKRRMKQLIESGAEADFNQILENVRQRDFIDSHREYHPTKKANDAIVLDNSHLTIDEQMIWLRGILKERFNIDSI